MIVGTKYGNKIKNMALKYEAAVRGNKEFGIFLAWNA
jgi:hypothetical protein